MFGYFKNIRPVYFIIFLILIIFIFGFEIYFFKNNIFSNGDFEFYIDLTQKIIYNNYIIPNEVFPNPLFIFLTMAASKIKGVSLNVASYFFVPLFSYIILGLLILKRLINVINNKVGFDNNYSRDAIFIALCLMLVGPISFITFPNLFIGYIGINIYHSPTQILAQPLALGVFLLLLSGLEQRTSSKYFMLSLAIVTFLSLLAKPSYLICLIPALFLFALFKLYKKTFINLNLIFFFFLVNFLVIAWQYWLTYGPGDPDTTTHIIFAPFAVLHNHVMLARQYWLNFVFSGTILDSTHETFLAPFLAMFLSAYSLLPRLIASICFPAAVYLAFFDTAKKTTSLNVAWLTFGVALVYSCFMAESGYRMYHGNFLGGMATSLFILFVCSAFFLIKENNLKIRKDLLSFKKNPKLAFCSCVFCLHLLSGILYYFKIVCGGWFG